MGRLKWALIFLSFSAFGQNEIYDDSSFVNYLCERSSFVSRVLNDSEYKVQLVYSAIDTKSDSTIIKTYEHLTDSYFFPASTVKLPVAIVVLEKLNKLGLSMDDVLKIENSVECGSKRYIQKLNEKEYSFRQILEELIVVSDNDFYNALYHFITPKELNARLNALGFTRTNIYRSFTGCDIVDHLHTNTCFVLSSDGDTLYRQEQELLNLCDVEECYIYSSEKKIGAKHEHERKILDGPYDFNFNLEIPLEELNEMMLRLIHPKSFALNERWDLSSEQRNFLIRATALFPGELKNVKYRNTKKYPRTIYKYTLSGYLTTDYDRLRSISKIGLSYGFTTEVAYVLIRDEGVVFQLAVSIYTNKNQTVNDGNYEYEEVARPFISEVSKLIYEYESNSEQTINEEVQELVRIVFD
jgi:hypothetical protein